MLFNSYIFLFGFLPITLVGFYLIGGRGHHRVAMSWLVAASLFFYGWWNPAYLGLIFASMLFNYAMGLVLGGNAKHKPRGLLWFGIAANLGLIGYFKYANFFVDNLNWSLGSSYHLETIILPLAISFFTFQQIAYLIDAHRGETREYNFLHYCLFVTFFPQLIAGPIVHHKEMLPQFARDIIYKLNTRYLAVGITIFIFGLFKKVVIADGVAVYATPVFEAAENGVALTVFEAWGGVLAYTLQLYFDFSGYSDMAIGLARMFGIILPLNFYSPYKARNIIDFWSRWHITLSRFLRDYLYIPLGGNRKGRARRYTNLMVTMLIGGLWHGAGWTFVMWGALHGFYLIVNHFWHSLRRMFGHDLEKTSMAGRGAARMLTLIAVMIGWAFFRAESFEGALNVVLAMGGANGISLPTGMAGLAGTFKPWLAEHGVYFNGLVPHDFSEWKGAAPALLIALSIALYFPNTLDIMAKYRPTVSSHAQGPKRPDLAILEFQISLRWAIFTALLLYLSVGRMSQVSEFLYFQF